MKNRLLEFGRTAVGAALWFGAVAHGADESVNTGEVTRLPEVVVMGLRAPVELGTQSVFSALPPRDVLARPLTESPGLDTTTSVVGREEIRWRNSPSVIDALQYVPGAWVESRGRKEKLFFSVRGQRYPYPGYLIDGAWFRSFDETAYHFNSANLGQIQVLRSSANLLQTPESLAGTVDLQPRDYTSPETQLDASLGSRLTTRNHLSHGNGNDQWGYAVGAGYYHTDGKTGRNAEENITDVYARLRGSLTPRLTLSLSSFALYGNRELELAEDPVQTILQTREQEFDPLRNHIVVGKLRAEPTDWAVTELIANFAHREYEFHSAGAADTMERDWEYGVRLTQGLQLLENNTLRISGLFNHWESPTGKRYFAGNPADVWTYMASVTDEQVLGPWTLNIGYRLSQTYYDEFGGYAVEGESGKLKTVQILNEWEDPLHTINGGAAYAITKDWTLLGNITWSQVAAPLSALNKDLERPKIETRTKVDVGLRRTWPQYGEVTLTVFWVDQKDATVLTNAYIKVDGVDYALYRNADARNYGVELETRTRRFDWGLQMFANLVAMQTELLNNDAWVRDREVPEVIASGGLSYLFRNWELSVLAKHVSRYENERFLPAKSEPNELADYVDLSARLAYHFGKDRRSKVYFSAHNLLNDEYSTVNGYYHDGLTLDGGVSWVF